MPQWSPNQYLKFADERTRPAADLLARVKSERVETAVDLGCGPGNSTELLARRFPDARLSGIDTSAKMIEAAQQRLPNARFAVEAIQDWQPDAPQDLIFANASLQWVPNHATLYPRLAGFLSEGGTLAFQIPDNLEAPSHTTMSEAARDIGLDEIVREAEVERTKIASANDYYGMLKPSCRQIDIWRTTYYHSLAGLDSIVEWLKGTGLLPYLSRMAPERHEAFLQAYRQRLVPHFPELYDGTVLLPFPRLFIVAVR
ncbi:MAG: trans-aconitate 2-methyltransferase [Methylobacterium mesophilicum]|nr:trans-aconitate 2-methyltransferase [Methylobacterium mesophilicum]